MCVAAGPGVQAVGSEGSEMTHPCLCGADAERRRQISPGGFSTVAGALKEEGSSLV